MIIENNGHVENVVSKIWPKIKFEIDRRFAAGQMTSTYATSEVAGALHNQGIPFLVVDGTLNGQQHWWIKTRLNQTDKTVVVIDLGNNLTGNGKLGKIRPIIMPQSITNENGYSEVNIMDFDGFAAYYKTISYL